MRLVIRYIILAISLLLFNLPSQAQEHDYIQYTTKDGLPTNYVYGVVEDDDGYIWAYTENGMAKFDGYEFEVFSTKDGLPGNDVHTCFKDKYGRLWLGMFGQKPPTYIYKDSIHIVYDQSFNEMQTTDNEIFYFSYKTNGGIILKRDSIQKFEHRSLNKGFLEKHSQYFKLDSVISWEGTERERGKFIQQGKYFLEQRDSVSFYTYRNLQISSFRMLGFNTQAILSTEKGILYIQKESDLKEFCIPLYKKANDVKIFKIPHLDRYLLKIDLYNIYILDWETESVFPIDIPVSSKLEEEPSVHINMLDSFMIFSSNTYHLEYNFNGYLLDQFSIKSISQQYYTLRTFVDSRKNLWVGTREGGLFFFPNTRKKTALITSKNASDKSFERILSRNNDAILGFTDNSGIYLIDDDTISLVQKPNKKNRFRIAGYTSHGIIISSSNSCYFLGDNYKFFSFTKKFNIEERDIFYSPSSLHYINSRTFAYDSVKDILYGSSPYHLLVYNILPESRIAYQPYYVSNISALFFDNLHETLYVANDYGVYKWLNFTLIPVIDTIESIKNISSLYSTSTHLWIGTESNGLFTYNYKNSNIHQISNASYIRRIRPDTDSTLLIASNEGILVVDSTQELQRFTLEDGLFSNEIQDVHYDGKRYIYVANTEGLLKLDRLATFEATLYPQDLRVTDILVNQQSIVVDTTLNLAYRENDLEIKYHLMSFASNQQIKYSTKLEPLESSWRSDDDRKIFYLNLLPERYVFHLKAEDIYGNEVCLPPIKINIHPAYWQTLWFKSGIALFLIGISGTYLFFWKRRQKKQIFKEKEINRKIADLELSALKAQMNPHFVFNALGAIQYYIQTNDATAADDYLTYFAQLIRKYLNSSREKVITLREEIELLKIYTTLEKMRFESLFEIEIKVEKDLAIEDISLPSMLIQPFVENAINHGLNERRDGNGALSIHFYSGDEILYCTVQDNGIGRINAQKKKRRGHHSRGMAIIEDKVNTLRNSGIADVHIRVHDMKSSGQEYPGTKVEITIRNLE